MLVTLILMIRTFMERFCSRCCVSVVWLSDLISFTFTAIREVGLVMIPICQLRTRGGVGQVSVIQAYSYKVAGLALKPRPV